MLYNSNDKEYSQFCDFSGMLVAFLQWIMMVIFR